MDVKTLSIPCPNCKKNVLMTDDFPDRPFCSKRCQMIDFGDWINEDNKIAGKPIIDESEFD